MTAAAAPAAPPELDLAFALEGPLAAALCLEGGALADGELGEAAWSERLSLWLADLQEELPAPLRRPAYSLGLQLTDDATIAGLNQRWRHRDGATDVLAFAAQEDAPPAPPPDWEESLPDVGARGDGDEEEEGEEDGGESGGAGSGVWAGAEEPLELGDIVISLETAARQAETAGHDLQQELLFLASHGLLHLLGWDHPDDATLAAMLQRQERLLERLLERN